MTGKVKFNDNEKLQMHKTLIFKSMVVDFDGYHNKTFINKLDHFKSPYVTKILKDVNLMMLNLNQHLK